MKLLNTLCFLCAVTCSVELGTALLSFESICDTKGCNCLAASHPSWTLVNCTLPKNKNLDILIGALPDTTSELRVQGGNIITVEAYSLSRLRDLRLIRLAESRIIVLHRGAALNLDLVNAYLEIEDCDELKVERQAFSNIGGPLSVSIRNCNSVKMEGEAFSWLLKMSIHNVQNLLLSTGVFALDPTAANVGEHGPGMSIELKNLTIPEIPANTFGSSAAEIVFESVVVSYIQPSAFSANTYNVIKIRDSTFERIEGEAFDQKSLINNLDIQGCKIQRIKSKGLQSAITKLNIAFTRFDVIEPGAVNSTVASVRITDSEFHTFMARGFELSSWNRFYMARNKFDTLESHAIIAPTTVVHQLLFEENEIEGLGNKSLEFIGLTFASKYAMNVVYLNNYYGVPCTCNVSTWLSEAMATKGDDFFDSNSFCTVNEFFARCFNEPKQNVRFKKFKDDVCNTNSNVQCEGIKIKDNPPEIKNPRFPHKRFQEAYLSDRDKKVIGIVITTALVCVVIVMIITLIKWMQRKGYCARIKDFLVPPNSSCGTLWATMCVCNRNNGVDNSRSISQLSVIEYSEHHRLHEPNAQIRITETSSQNVQDTVDITPMDNKATQTLPEELTKELLENLKEKLDDPENSAEAREMIEHLYELIKVEECCNANYPVTIETNENIYDLPFQNTSIRIGKNKKQMISVATKTPSLDKLLPLSPYNRQTSLAHEYFEPKDFAVHLYAEINNSNKEKKCLLGAIPDVVEQIQEPRGPYLRAVMKNSNSSPLGKSYMTSNITSLPGVSDERTRSPSLNPSTLKLITSISAGKMINRPLPDKPGNYDPGEGTSSMLAI